MLIFDSVAPGPLVFLHILAMFRNCSRYTCCLWTIKIALMVRTKHCTLFVWALSLTMSCRFCFLVGFLITKFHDPLTGTTGQDFSIILSCSSPQLSFRYTRGVEMLPSVIWFFEMSRVRLRLKELSPLVLDDVPCANAARESLRGKLHKRSPDSDCPRSINQM